MNEHKPLLIMFLGSPGSGKSYFARQLAAKDKMVRLNGDSMRMAIYGSVEEIDARKHKKPEVTRRAVGAINYAVEQVLITGTSVVYDMHHNKRSIREGLEQLAVKCNAVPIVVWVKTPYEVALQRGQTREATADQRQLDAEAMAASIERHMANMNEPIESEHVITIDGTVDFEKQYESYQTQLHAILTA